MSKLVELREDRRKLQAEMIELFKKLEESPNAETAQEIKTRNGVLADLNIQIDGLVELDEIKSNLDADVKAARLPVPHPGSPGGEQPSPFNVRVKSARQLLTEHRVGDIFKGGARGTVRFEYEMFGGADREAKTLLTLSDIAPQAQLDPGFVPYAVESRTVGDLMLQGTTNSNSIQYYEQTTRTNAAVEVAEGSVKPEAAIDFTLRTDPVETIAVWLPVTKQALEDVPFLESMIREELRFMVEQREELQLLVGNGTTPNISGILDRSGIQTQAKGADSTPDAIFKAITLVRNTGFAEPTAIVLHPNDWQGIRLLTTTDGIYIWGPPSQAGADTIWGLPVRVTSNLTENTGLVGAFRPYAKRVRRSAVEVTLSTEHDTYFIYNKVAILAEERLALQVTRPAAFATVTGI